MPQRVLIISDGDKTRWALDVMTAWAHSEAGDFVHDRIDGYVGEPGGRPGLITGLVNLSGLLLMGLEAATGKATPEILQAIAATLSRREHAPGDS